MFRGNCFRIFTEYQEQDYILEENLQLDRKVSGHSLLRQNEGL